VRDDDFDALVRNLVGKTRDIRGRLLADALTASLNAMLGTDGRVEFALQPGVTTLRFDDPRANYLYLQFPDDVFDLGNFRWDLLKERIRQFEVDVEKVFLSS
jgi:hypothetical protein